MAEIPSAPGSCMRPGKETPAVIMSEEENRGLAVVFLGARSPHRGCPHRGLHRICFSDNITPLTGIRASPKALPTSLAEDEHGLRARCPSLRVGSGFWFQGDYRHASTFRETVLARALCRLALSQVGRGPGRTPVTYASP